jgi:hypothetical protein
MKDYALFSLYTFDSYATFQTPFIVKGKAHHAGNRGGDVADDYSFGHSIPLARRP